MGDAPTPPPRPTWVKVSLIVALVIVAAVVVAALVSSGHGPGRHMPGGGEAHTPPVEHGP